MSNLVHIKACPGKYGEAINSVRREIIEETFNFIWISNPLNYLNRQTSKTNIIVIEIRKNSFKEVSSHIPIADIINTLIWRVADPNKLKKSLYYRRSLIMLDRFNRKSQSFNPYVSFTEGNYGDYYADRAFVFNKRKLFREKYSKSNRFLNFKSKRINRFTKTNSITRRLRLLSLEGTSSYFYRDKFKQPMSIILLMNRNNFFYKKNVTA